MSDRPKIPRNVKILGWVSLFNDAASEMLYPIMPLFITATLGASPAILGLIDGFAEGLGSCLRWVGGALSDRIRKRKIFVLLGYIISALSKPIMGLSAFIFGWPIFMVGRSADRLGKASRNAPRDALIAASTPEEIRGWAFGFQRTMDTIGAIIGPLVAHGIIIWMTNAHEAFSAAWKTGSETLQALPLKWLFFVALIPGLAAVLCVGFVKEIPPHGKTKTGGKPPPIFQSYPKRLYFLILAVFVFSLGNSSDTFLILRSSQVGMTFGWIVILYAAYNIVYASVAGPAGKLSDYIGRKPLLIAGWLVYAIVYIGFATLRAAWLPWVFLATYGLYQGLTDGVTSALVSDTVPDEKRAGAIGLFYTVTGLGQFAASLIAGALYNISFFHGAVHLPFAIGAACALAAIPLLLFTPTRTKTH
ncbi:MAG TPA: MFS transporter [Tepidisphaeraceae bacterium]|nr:MFS transporter [Tepidisphaeraceae bacterium]